MPHKPPGGGDGAGDGSSRSRREIYLEFKQVGKAMKVVAVDAASGVEVVIFGPVSASRNDLERVAVRKLDKQLRKTNNQDDPPDDDEGPPPKGWIV